MVNTAKTMHGEPAQVYADQLFVDLLAALEMALWPLPTGGEQTGRKTEPSFNSYSWCSGGEQKSAD